MTNVNSQDIAKMRKDFDADMLVVYPESNQKSLDFAWNSGHGKLWRTVYDRLTAKNQN